MKIVIEDLLKVASNLEKRVEKINIDIEKINEAIYGLSNISSISSDTISELAKSREYLYVVRDKFLKLAEVVYISLNYYIRWDEANASYCYDDKVIYPNKDKRVVDLTEIKNILGNMGVV